MNKPALIPPVTNDDRIPHEQAVWRAIATASDMTGHLQVSVDYGDGQIVQGRADEISWRGVKRWRFGWAPQ